jgi:DNA primase
VEGEPDRVSGVEIGLNACAVPGVATWKAGWAERFLGRRVVVCFDCDEPGRAAAANRAFALRQAGVDVVSVDLFPGRTDGYDLGDALVAAHAEGRVDDLRRYLVRLEDEAWRAAA